MVISRNANVWVQISRNANLYWRAGGLLLPTPTRTWIILSHFHSSGFCVFSKYFSDVRRESTFSVFLGEEEEREEKKIFGEFLLMWWFWLALMFSWPRCENAFKRNRLSIVNSNAFLNLRMKSVTGKEASREDWSNRDVGFPAMGWGVWQGRRALHKAALRRFSFGSQDLPLLIGLQPYIQCRWSRRQGIIESLTW